MGYFFLSYLRGMYDDVLFFTVCGNENAQKEISALLPVGEGTINIWSPVSVSASVQL